jgi:hypothetical protein
MIVPLLSWRIFNDYSMDIQMGPLKLLLPFWISLKGTFGNIAK